MNKEITMKYGIVKTLRDSSSFIEIEPEKYKKVMDANSALLEVFHIEEKLYLIVENYREYEQDLLNTINRYMLFSPNDWSAEMEEISKINRRIMNLLAACRLYLDTIVTNLKNIYGDSDDKPKAVKDEKSKQFDGNLDYRFMEQLRNVAHHAGFSVRKLRYNQGKIGDCLNYNATPYISVYDLQRNKKFKKGILDEMKMRGNNIDLNIR
ncbi:MAG: hypothetical protein ISR95_08995 [Candidatus Marinimicrobia bacterium]|nr:hypothetical protein [Candidatus Brocadiales bacterium]MBL7047746.1 hypothetical protein [Candidatus Neomarinimicrobiota bacterium]